MAGHDRSFLDLEGATPLKPLVGFALLTLCAFAAHPQGSDWRYVALAALTFVGGAALAWVGANRDDWFALAPAIAALVAIALLRESQGGSTSGYSPLVVLAVVWVALVLDRHALLLITACTALMFALPLVLIRAPTYPSSGWRGAVLLTIVAYVVGELAQRSVTQMRRQTAEAQKKSEELEEMQRAFGAMASVAREIALGTEARELVCTAALTSLDATMATVVEPRDNAFVITGTAGIPLARADIRRVDPHASLQAFHSGRRIFIADAREDARVAPAIVQATGVISLVYEPIVRDGESVGVLAVGWKSHRTRVDAKTDAIMRFLAAEAGAAIERADLLAQLDGLARSDPLTGLANRRTWNDAIASALRDETALCVAMIDLDHFKKYNDEHGHAAGDRLLKACAAAWRTHLRSDDTLARVGGEEFAALLPRCSITDAADVLERLRQATPSGATASIGVAEIQPGEDATDLLARADAALYEAKSAGRNQLLAAT
jgi:diguanylate cyclase (GGDEF)-like protein